MPRKQLIRTHLFPYHITARSNNKDWFELPMEQVWRICLMAMKKAYAKHPVDIISFVLMNNHYHLIVKTPNCDIDLFMYEFNKNISLHLRFRTERVNKMFGGRYKRCLIQSNRYFANCYRYVYQNPMRAKLVNRCEIYPYSSLYYKAKGIGFAVPLFDKMGFSDEFKLIWLNETIDELEVQAIKNGLYRSVLTSLQNPMTRRHL